MKDVQTKSSNQEIKKKRIKNRRRKHKRKAFTLIEILAVVIIIGIIALIAIPSVSQYIKGASDTTYQTYENTMKDAASNKVIKCLSTNDSSCNIPEKDEKRKVQLKQLIDEGYIDPMKDPDSNDFCDNEISFVEVQNKGTSDFEYTACLFCGEYKTDKSVCTTNSTDSDDPECGEVTGESTRWTNVNRTISVKCSDKTSGCAKSTFSKVFDKTTREGNITIVDNSGRSKVCKVNAYVDKTLPSCELEVEKGDYLDDLGWYTGNVTVKIKSYDDKESGILTYGMGMSLSNRNYNKQTQYEITNSGITTIIGYVKDKAGNEGVCSLDVKIGGQVPSVDFKYGYQIYPNKESYTIEGITENGAKLTTTSATPKIKFDGLSKYGKIERVKITLNSAITASSVATLTYDGKTATSPVTAGQKTIEFLLSSVSTSKLEITLGKISGVTYDISKIELLTNNGGTYTNKDVSINVETIDRGAKTSGISFDNGLNFGTENVKVYQVNTTNSVVAKNVLGMVSESKKFDIIGIDKVIPTVTISASKKKTGSIVQSGNWSNEGLNFTLNAGTVGISGANIYYCKDTTDKCNPTTRIDSGVKITDYNTIEGTFYIRYKIVSGAGSSSKVLSYQAKIDTNVPTVSIKATKKTAKSEVPSGTWSNEGLNFKFTQGKVGESGATIYYCQDGSNTCSPSTAISNGIELTTYNNTTGIYYVRYRIVSKTGVNSEISSYKAKIDSTKPSMKIKATKAKSGVEVESGKWSSEGLNFVLSQVTTGASGATIKYCKDTTNTCTPSTTVSNGTKVTTYNTLEGIYYIRYQITGGTGISSEIGSYQAKVDTDVPSVKVTATKKTAGTTVSSNTWSNEGLNFKFDITTSGSSAAITYYCKDTTNTCTPSTVISSGTTITSYNTLEGTYYIRYQSIKATGVGTDIETFVAKVDSVKPTMKIKATKKNSNTEVSSGTWSTEGLNFELMKDNVGVSGATIKYCKDTNNTCAPTTTISSGIKLTTYNTTEGIYYIRYQITSGAGLSSSIGSYKAQVDLSTPTCTISISPDSYASSATLTVTGKDTGGSGLAASPYSWTSSTAGFGTVATKTVTENKTYTAYVKDNAGRVGSCSKTVSKIDSVTPTVKINATNKDSGTSVAQGDWSSEGLNFTLTGVTGVSGGTIYYCKDTNNTCTPTTTVASGTLITKYNDIEGVYYIRYYIKNGAGVKSSTGSYKAQVNKSLPSARITAKKKTSGTSVSSGSWSNEGLNFVIDQTGTAVADAIIYYCKDTTNTCTPSTVTTTGSTITAYNTIEGIYYVRYKIVGKTGISSGTSAYVAKVDSKTPTVSVNATKKTSGTSVPSGSWSNEGLDFTFSSGNVGASGATIKYCKDTANTCTPSTTATPGTKITSYNGLTGTYYIRYKIVSGVGLESGVSSYNAKVDTSTPTCTITASPKSWTKNDVTLTINGSNSGSSGISLYSWDNSTYNTTKTKKVSSNSTVTGYVKNGSGAIGSCSYKVTNIDKSAPTVTVTVGKPGNGGYTTGYITASDSGNSGIDYINYCIGGSSSCTPSTKYSSELTIRIGQYLCGIAYDKAGNASSTKCQQAKDPSCDKGKYNSGGTCVTCTAGYYCPGGEEGRKACPSGYTSKEGATEISKCYVSVPAGKHKTSSTGSSVANCSTGSYKGAHDSYYGSSDSCSNCPSGFTSDSGATGITKCYKSATVSKWTETRKGCGRELDHYNYAFTTSKASSSTCSVGTAFTCNASNYDKSYVSSCDGNYAFTTNTTNTATCATSATFTCNKANAGKSYVSSCVNNSTYAFNPVTTHVTTCSSGGTFTCNEANAGKSYVSSCIDISTYSFTPSTTKVATCSSGGSFTCSQANVGKSYVSSCADASTYSFVSSTKSVSSCTKGTAFTCNKNNVAKNYVQNCTDTSTYAFSDSTSTVAKCSKTNAFTCNSGGVGKSYVSSCVENVKYHFTEHLSSGSTCKTVSVPSCIASNYGKSYIDKCTDASTFSFSSSTTSATSCTKGTAFTCNASNTGKSYVSACTDASTYAFSSSTTSVTSCSKGSSFTCNASNSGKSYVSACSDASTYAFTSSTTSVTSCSKGTAFTCNSSNSGKSYVSACADASTYSFSSSSSTVSSCKTSKSFTCNSSNSGKSYVSSCTYNSKTKKYSKTTKTCKKSKKYNKTTKTCKKTTKYNKTTQTCKKTTKYNKTTQTCKKTTKYEIHTRYCDKTTNYTKTTRTCQKTTKYNQTTLTCAKNTLYEKRTQTCTKSQLWEKRTQNCVKTPSYKRTTKKCEASNYSKTTKKCDRTEVYKYSINYMSVPNRTSCKVETPTFTDSTCNASTFGKPYVSGCTPTEYSCPSGTTKSGTKCYYKG